MKIGAIGFRAIATPKETTVKTKVYAGFLDDPKRRFMIESHVNAHSRQVTFTEIINKTRYNTNSVKVCITDEAQPKIHATCLKGSPEFVAGLKAPEQEWLIQKAKRLTDAAYQQAVKQRQFVSEMQGLRGIHHTTSSGPGGRSVRSHSGENH